MHGASWWRILTPLAVPLPQANEVEQALWKSVYYKPIEEFRSRTKTAQVALQQAQALIAQGPGPDGAIPQGQYGSLEDIQKQLQKLTQVRRCAAFKEQF